jgi:hypothetical protein
LTPCLSVGCLFHRTHRGRLKARQEFPLLTPLNDLSWPREGCDIWLCEECFSFRMKSHRSNYLGRGKHALQTEVECQEWAPRITKPRAEGHMGLTTSTCQLQRLKETQRLRVPQAGPAPRQHKWARQPVTLPNHGHYTALLVSDSS